LNDVPLSFTILVLLTFIVKEKEEVKLFWELRLGMFVFPNGVSQSVIFLLLDPSHFSSNPISKLLKKS